jgi:uncharacterized protein YjbI with pentapeptide repeats
MKLPKILPGFQSKSLRDNVILAIAGSTIVIGGYLLIARLDKTEASQNMRAEFRDWVTIILYPTIAMSSIYCFNQEAEKRNKKQLEQQSFEENKNRENREKIAQQERELREVLAKKDRQEQQEQSDLDYYFDRLAMLITQSQLSKNQPNYQIARALTANILRKLSHDRMNQVIFFLSSLDILGEKDSTTQQNLELRDQLQDQLQDRLHSTAISIVEGIKLNGADLIGLNARGVNFARANFSRAILLKADLSGSDFSGADLTGVNLSGADLQDADLSEANLSGAILRGANLSGANLSHANLSGANLFGINLAETILFKANFLRADTEGASFLKANLTRTQLSVNLSDEQQKQCAIYEPIIIDALR